MSSHRSLRATSRAGDLDRDVKFDVVIENLLGVSSSAQTFSVRFWLDIELNLTDEEVEKFQADPKTSPASLSDSVLFLNAVAIKSHKVYTRMDGSVGRLEGDRRFFQRALFQGTFQEEMELASFPFDVQELTIKFQLNPYDDVRWSWSDVSPGMRFQVPSGEWLIPNATWDRPEDSWIGPDVSDPSVATVKILVMRNWRFYLLHYISILMMTTAMLPSALKFESLGEMLGFISTMFLAGVAMLFVLEPCLPKQKDLNLFDKYVAWSFLFSFASALVGFIAEIRPDVNRQEVGGWLMQLLFGVWIISHLGFLASALMTYWWEQKKLVFFNHSGAFADRPRCKTVIRGQSGYLEPFLCDMESDTERSRECTERCTLPLLGRDRMNL